MKKLLLTLTGLIYLSTTTFSQDFSTKFYIENKSGRKDSIELGYASDATFGIDSKYNETAIDHPLAASNKNVLIGVINETTSYIGELIRNNTLNTYTKKQIVELNNLYIETSAIPILVPTDSLPLTISWNKTLFNDSKRDYSLITDWRLGGWFDAGDNTTREFLKNTNSVTLTRSVENYQVIDGSSQQTYSLFYVAFGNWVNTISIFDGTNSILQSKDISIHINNRSLTINNQSQIAITNIKLLSITGSLAGQWNYCGQSLDMSQFSKGVYIISIDTNEGTRNFKVML
ncbi:MAG: hypothetical protein RIS29_80 [Bacteroidota bacterium]|jgi:hypothetical protein